MNSVLPTLLHLAKFELRLRVISIVQVNNNNAVSCSRKVWHSAIVTAVKYNAAVVAGTLTHRIRIQSQRVNAAVAGTDFAGSI